MDTGQWQDEREEGEVGALLEAAHGQVESQLQEVV